MNYRFKALAKMRDPDRLDAAMTLASPRGWIATLVVASCLLMSGVWVAFGTVPHSVTGSGRLMYAGGIVHVESPVAGQLTRLPYQPGQEISPGTTVAVVQAGTRAVPVTAGVGGRVVRSDTRLGAVVAAGTDLVALEPGYRPGAVLQADVLVPASAIAGVKVGSPTLLQVSGHDPRKVGMLRGRVHSITAFPEPTSDETVGPTRITVTLERADTESGYAWTSHAGPTARLVSQTPVVAEINIGSRSPMQAVAGG